MERTEAVQSSCVTTAVARAMLPAQRQSGHTRYDVALQMALDRLDEPTCGPGGVEAALLLLQLAADGYDVGAVEEAGSILAHHAALIATVANIVRSLCDAISRLAVRSSLPMADVSSEAAGMQRLAPSADQVAWYASDVDAGLELVPIPVTASPHLTNAPPPVAIVLHSADVAIGWAA